MQLDKINYFILVDKILSLFQEIFGDDMIFVEKKEAFEHMGYFKVIYRYFPLGYNVVFESECNVFCIDIYDEEGAKNSLYRIEKIENVTEIKNIHIALQTLKTVLERNDFSFYITRDGKLYRKKDRQYKKVKDLTELMGR